MSDKSISTLPTKQLPASSRSGYHKLFVGDASKSFIQYLKKNNYSFKINSISSREDLIEFIELYSTYKGYKLPVIVSDISFLNKKDQSLLLKFMEDTDLNLILLASRDNILDTVVSRVNEFRKFYIKEPSDKAGFIQPGKARSAIVNDNCIDEDTSYDDRLLVYNKYNPILSYDDFLVKSFRNGDKNRLLSLLES